MAVPPVVGPCVGVATSKTGDLNSNLPAANEVRDCESSMIWTVTSDVVFMRGTRHRRRLSLTWSESITCAPIAHFEISFLMKLLPAMVT